MKRMEILAPEGIGPIVPGDDLAHIVLQALSKEGMALEEGDIVVLAHKVVSKAEGQVVDLSPIKPSPQALALAQETGKDASLVQVVLNESQEVLKARPGVLITRHRLGFVCANAAVDHSNAGGGRQVVTLPKAPDRSARALSQAFMERTGKRVAVAIADTHGRSFRNGAIGVCVGAYGMEAIHGYQGKIDRDGSVLQSSQETVADEVCSAATLLMGQGDESRPLAIIRGLRLPWSEEGARPIFRDPEQELFV